MSVAIRIENVSKLYRLGTVGTGTLSHDINRWWHRIRGKEDPYAKIGQVNDRTQGATSDEQRDASDSNGDSSSPLASRRSPLRASGPEYVWALKDINLEVAQGEILGIIGRNGAGKSTLLKLLSRVTAPTTGSIKTRGRIASLLEVGTGFHPELTGRENIYLNGAILGMKRHEIELELDSIVDFSGCEKYLDTPVKRYSSGMKVRLGFAVAAHLQCEILIVDEVLAVGDAEFQRKSVGKMGEVAESGRTVLLVSHNMQTMQRLCDRCVQLQAGRISSCGNPDEIVSGYISQEAQQCSNDVKPSDSRVLRERFGLTLQNVDAVNTSGKSSSEFRYGEEVLVRLKFRMESSVQSAQKTNPALSIGVSVSDLSGTRLLHFHSFDHSFSFSQGGTTTVELAFENVLRGGDYIMGIWIGDQNNNSLWYRPGCILLQSVSRPEDSPFLKAGIVLPCRWNTSGEKQ
ncbi:MAG: ABC transporter ATP-binding protein [Fuerstiella sp.]